MTNSKLNLSLGIKVLAFIVLLFSSTFSWAQCGPITGVSTTVTNASCPSNGVIVVNSSVANEPTATYRFLSGPTGYPTNSFSSRTIPSLAPGDYQIQITCGSNNTTVNATVGNNYTPPSATVTASSCTSYTTGGNIVITKTGGSSAPIKYAVVLSNDPLVTVPDAAYLDLNTSVTYGAASFGTYQVKLKDGCNNIVNYSIDVAKSKPKATFNPWIDRYTCTSIVAKYNINNFDNGSVIDKTGANYKLELWQSTSASCPSTVPTGAPSQTIIVDDAAQDYDISVPKATRNVFWRVTSACGEVATGCVPLDPYQFTVTPRVNVNCLGQATSIAFRHNGTANFTATYTFKNAAGTVVGGPYGPTTQTYSTFYFSSPAPATATRIDYTFTDGCGSTVTSSVAIPNATTGVTITEGPYFDRWCTSVLGTGVASVYIGGFIPDWDNVTEARVQMVPVGGGAAYTAVEINRETGYCLFFNIPPGSYNLVVQSAGGTCSASRPVTLTGDGLTFNLTGQASQLCGGLGTITAMAATNSSTPINYRLKNSSGTLIATDPGGVFANLPAGTYTVEAYIKADCSSIPEYVQTKSFTIAPGNGGPQIIKKIGIVCKPSGTTGIAALTYAGAGPFKIERKLSTASTYTTVANSTSQTTFTESGLTPNATYNYRITDNCNNTSVTDVTILDLNNVQKLTTQSPCVGSPYTLAVEELPGATYSWTKNGADLGTNSPQIQFGSFAATDNGRYVCTVSYGGCVTLTATYDINSNFCGSPLMVTFGAIQAFLRTDKLEISWSTMKEESNDHFEIEVSNDGKTFKKIGSVVSKANAGNSSEKLEYSFSADLSSASALAVTAFALFLIPAFKRRKKLLVLVAIVGVTVFGFSCTKTKSEFLEASGGNIFVRIAQIDKDGTKSYSKIVKVVVED